MKKAKVLVWIAVFALLLCCCGGMTASAATTDEGLTFNLEEAFHTKEPITELPVTLEANLRFPPETVWEERGGIILGNYQSSTAGSISFEIHKYGQPRYFALEADGKYTEVFFDEVDVCTGEWVHLAIVLDHEKGEISCYVNGECKQTIEKVFPQTVTMANPMVLGGDMRSGNTQYFKGILRDVTVYSDKRTPDEIRDDYQDDKPDTDNLIGHYDLRGKTTTLTDSNGKGPEFNLVSRSLWVKDHESVKDYDYSFAVLGDTQSLTYYYPDKLPVLYDWIVNNAEEKKIKFVMGLGDITDQTTYDEWTLAKEQITKLDGVVPYSVIRGNHDEPGVFRTYFDYEEFKDKISGSYNDTLLNTYHKLKIGNTKYLIFALDVGPTDKILNWMDEVIRQHKDYNVIITTHIYLYTDGTTSDANDPMPATKYGGSNTGDQMWDKLIRKHENIVLVLSGHFSSDKIIVSKAQGDHGNTVTQMMIDPQTTDKTYQGAGLVAMLYFSEGGKKVDVEYYSTIRDEHFLEENQFSMELDTVDAGASPIVWVIVGAAVLAIAVIAIVLVMKKKRA